MTLDRVRKTDRNFFPIYMNNELIVEHLGFAPIHFVDDVLNIVNQNLYKALTRFEHQVENELGIAETEKRMQHVETLFERAIDSKFDRFELYVLNNILTIPNHKQVILPHYAVSLVNLRTWILMYLATMKTFWTASWMNYV